MKLQSAESGMSESPTLRDLAELFISSCVGYYDSESVSNRVLAIRPLTLSN